MASQLLVLLLIIFVPFSPSEGHAPSYGDQSVPPQIETQNAVKTSIAQAQTIRALIPPVYLRPPMDAKQSRAVDDCVELYDLTVGFLTDSLSILTESSLDRYKAVDIQTYLSAALTNVVTSLDGLKEANVNLRLFSFTDHISNTSQSVSHCLALVNKFWIAGGESEQTSVSNRRLLSDASEDDFMSQYGSIDDGFPSWLSRADRRLLLHKQTQSGVKLNGNVVTVAQNGSGNFTTITDAINAVAKNSANRSVIYVTAGVYEEYVSVASNKHNIMLIGDGRDVTVITGNRSVVDNSTTYNSATLATVGQGFIARDLTIQNTAGAIKHQAVALRVGADRSVFYKCSFKGYQDTLYTFSLRQFYRECNIYGTVDFIFGNSAVVFQNCTLLARAPLKRQKNTFTAQGRTDPNQNTGISIHKCNVTAAPELVPVISLFPTYLGRPWKLYSRTVYMKSYLDGLIQPVGWLEWSGDFALSTLYYGEYKNKGPGSQTSQRVTWPGYHVMKTGDAQNFTVRSFISGDAWLRATSIPYGPSL
uniref:Pectinesterase n=1 Tax=Cunninghamia lanceolata TaxID=28977 RepID=A0A6G9W435_CUNLA|nr:pectin methylesterase 27 [Cunninghamia lanceolata]